MNKGILVAAAIVASTIGAASAENFSVPIDKDFTEETITVNGVGPAYEFVWDLRNFDGKVAVCGAGRYVDVSYQSALRQKLRGAVLELNGKPALRDLTFFTKVKPGADLKAGKATCRVSSMAVPKGEISVSVTYPGGFLRD